MLDLYCIPNVISYSTLFSIDDFFGVIVILFWGSPGIFLVFERRRKKRNVRTFTKKKEMLGKKKKEKNRKIMDRGPRILSTIFRCSLHVVHL